MLRELPTPLQRMLTSYLVHVGYSLMLLALLARDVLWLRLLLVAAQANLSAYSWFRGIDSIAAWNALFVLINALWVIRILRERRAVMLPPELARIHDAHFAALDPAEFLRLWRLGERRIHSGAVLTLQGEQTAALYYLLRGAVAVLQDGREVARLGEGDFVAEMSLLTGAAASAETRTVGEVELLCWPAPRLQALRSANPALWSRIQSVLGRDLVNKIQRVSRGAPAAAMPAETV
jgi:CRP-like cAMP-binding protein